LACEFKGGAEGIRTPDPLDANRAHRAMDAPDSWAVLERIPRLPGGSLALTSQRTLGHAGDQAGLRGANALFHPLAKWVKNDTMSVIQLCTEVPAAVGSEMIQMTIRITTTQPMIFATKRSASRPS
jgi:hypothetical protein